MLGVVGVVGPGVVLGGPARPEAELAHRAPREVAEVQDQVGRHALDLAVDLLGPEGVGAERPPIGAAERFDLGRQVAPHGLVVARGDLSGGLAPGDVHREAAVVAALAPRPRPVPVDAALLQRHRLRARRRVGVHAEIAVLDQPLVDAQAALHRLAAMVRDHQHHRLGRHQVQQPADQPVDMDVVVVDRVLEAVARLVAGVPRVHVAPVTVMDPVHAHVHEHEVVVALAGQEPARDVEVLVGEGVDVAEDLVLVVRAEVRHVDQELAGDPALDLRPQRGREGELAAVVGREEAADNVAVDRLDRIGLRHADGRHPPAVGAEVVPHSWMADVERGGDAQPLVRAIQAVAEAVDPQLPGIAAGHHGRPGGHGDRGHRALERAVDAAPHQLVEDGQVGAPAVEDELRRGAVEADHEHRRGVRTGGAGLGHGRGLAGRETVRGCARRRGRGMRRVRSPLRTVRAPQCFTLYRPSGPS